MSTKVNIVVIGAGIIGVSVAYHLAQSGVQDILLLDKGDLDENDGSTSHAPGGLRVLTLSDWYTRLGSNSRKLYDTLPLAVAGQEQFFRTGMVQVAGTAQRFESYQRLQEMGLTFSEPSQLLSAAEVAEKIPLLDPGKIVGGIWIPNAGIIKTSLVATSLRKQAEATGHVTSVSHTQVTEVVAEHGRVRAILTDNPELPRIDCEQVVLCSNIWAPLLCEKLGVPMPLFPGQHQYIYTEPFAALDPYKSVEVNLPVATLDDISIYYRQHHDRVGIGSYAHKAMLVDPYALGREAKLPFTPDDFRYAWGLMQELMPSLKTTRISHGFNGMFAFTVDGMPIVGETAVKGFWTNVGAWLSFAGELGNVLARWLTTGDPGLDMRQADVNRFHPYQSNHDYLSRQSKYFYEIGFDIIHPAQVASSVRDLRLSPYHDRLQALGAATIPFAGIETAFWYEANAPLIERYADRIPERSGWDAQYWSPIQGAEHLALRDNVGLVDWSAGIGPIEVSGAGAGDYLNYLCSNNVARQVGDITYTLWLTPSGGIRRDVTVVRLSADRFWVMTGKAGLPGELAWMQQIAAEWSGVDLQIRDRSDEFISLALWGPKARAVLQKVSSEPVDPDAFPFYTAQSIGVGLVPALALRLSYAGELGWELYAPANYGARLWDTLWEAGRTFNMHACGIGALLSLRLEKAYRLYGTDMDTERSPQEAGLDWLVDAKKPTFVGREAALSARQHPPSRRLVTVAFSEPEAMMYGFEPVFVGDEVVGRITSGNTGYSVGHFVALAYVANAYSAKGTPLRVRYNGHFYDGVVADDVLFDPANQRLKA